MTASAYGELAPMALPPMEREPLVSVILANYNYAHYLGDAIESVLGQTYSKWELIVCDDGSTDGSVNIARSFEARDPRVRVLAKENGGQVSAWNLSYQHCQGAVICFLDSDDTFHPQKLGIIVRKLKDNPEIGLVYHRFQYADAHLRPLDLYGPEHLPSGWLPHEALSKGQAFASKTSDFAIRREVLDCLMPLPEELPFADGYICRLATFITEIGSVPDTLSLYRIHGSNAMGNVTLLEKRTLVPLVDLLHSSFRLEEAFLHRRFGEGLGAHVRLERLVYYWRAVGALYILDGKPSEGVHGYSSDEILAILSDLSQKHVWWILFTLPSFVSSRLLHLWWSERSWKRVVRPIAGFLNLREKRST